MRFSMGGRKLFLEQFPALDMLITPTKKHKLMNFLSSAEKRVYVYGVRVFIYFNCLNQVILMSNIIVKCPGIFVFCPGKVLEMSWNFFSKSVWTP